MKPIFLSIGLAIALAAPLAAMATLGEVATSVQTDATHMKAEERVTQNDAAYAVHELRLPSGTVVKEYTAPGGKVFAVTWQGPSLPDLQQLLGAYFNIYLTEAQKQSASRSQLLIQQPQLVVKAGGHLRAFVGRAYVPQLVPQNLVIDNIQ